MSTSQAVFFNDSAALDAGVEEAAILIPVRGAENRHPKLVWPSETARRADVRRLVASRLNARGFRPVVPGPQPYSDRDSR
jgi:hypothetical protein